MRMLRDLQFGFARALLDQNGQFGEHVRANGLSGARRLRVYQNNVFESLSSALRAVYPVITRLVGEECFDSAAHRYIRQHPSASGNLHAFGAKFPEFIEGTPAFAELPYLPDVARLEWACHEVYHAGEPEPLDLAAVAAVPPARYEALRFALHPASRILGSRYPILHIWRVNQANYVGDPSVDLREGGIKLLVIRRRLEIEIEPLSKGEYALLRALAQDRNMGYACECALSVEPGLDLTAALRSHVARHTLVDYRL